MLYVQVIHKHFAVRIFFSFREQLIPLQAVDFLSELCYRFRVTFSCYRCHVCKRRKDRLLFILMTRLKTDLKNSCLYQCYISYFKICKITLL